MAEWRPEGQANPAGAPLRRRRRRRPVETVSDVLDNDGTFIVPDIPDSSERFLDHKTPRRRYAGPMIGSKDVEATTRYFNARAKIARKQGHHLEGGVIGPGTFHAACACGAQLSPGELSAVTTPCRLLSG